MAGALRGVEPLAVVDQAHPELVVVHRQRHRQLAGAGVLEGVGHRLAEQEVRPAFHVGGHGREWVRGDLERAGQRQPSRVTPHRRGQAPVAEDGGVEVVGHVAQPLDGAVQL